MYKAEQISTGQLVAVKVLRPNKAFKAEDADIERARFTREMRLIAKLKHPNIVRLIDTGLIGQGQSYMVLEYIEGEDLHELIQREGPLAVRDAKHLMTQVMDALSSAHSHGIVHRDLKPQNLMITRQGYRRNAMVLDFGIAAVMTSSRDSAYKTLTRGSQIHGTPSYMAPEQLKERHLTPQIDIYAWGLVFLECLTGRRVVVGETPLDIAMQQVMPKAIALPDHLDDGIRHILSKALAKSLKDRYASAIEVLADLEAYDAMLVSGNFSSKTPASFPSLAASERANTNPSAPSTDELSNTKVFQGDIDRALASMQGGARRPASRSREPSPMGIHSSLPSVSFDIDPTPNPTLDGQSLSLDADEPALGAATRPPGGRDPSLDTGDVIADGPAALGLSRPGTLSSAAIPAREGEGAAPRPTPAAPGGAEADEAYNRRVLAAIGGLLLVVVLLLVWMLLR